LTGFFDISSAMRKFIFVFQLLLLQISARSQQTVCDCKANLDSLIVKTEQNYAGYPEKIKGNQLGRYRSMVSSLRKAAGITTTPKACYELLADYVRFFYDKHFIVAYQAGADVDSVVVPTTEARLNQSFKNTRPSTLEGRWIRSDSAIQVAIVQKKPGLYEGIRLSSKVDNFPVGFVYFTIQQTGEKLHVKEFDRFISTSIPVKLYGNLLQFWNETMYSKMNTAGIDDREQKELTAWNRYKGLYYEEPAADIAYLRIASFGNNDQQIAELVARHDSAIRSRPYLIIDLRGNSGGSTGWVSLLPYLMTGPIEQAPSLVRVTPDNVKLKLADLEPFATGPIPEEYRKYFPAEILEQYKKAYTELPLTIEAFYPVPGVRFPLDSITRFPKKVALIVDDRCGSSAEYFFYLTRQSSKTIRYGTNTIGMMDYEGMSVPLKMPSNQFIVTIPSVKSSWTDKAPIDKTGFRPDVLLHQPYLDWITAVIKDLRRY
jgi:hypothetical protein